MKLTNKIIRRSNFFGFIDRTHLGEIGAGGKARLKSEKISGKYSFIVSSISILIYSVLFLFSSRQLNTKK